MSVRAMLMASAGVIPPPAPTTWTFTVSGTYSGHIPPSQARMSDGSSDTYWGSASASTAWIMADFGGIRKVSAVHWRAAPAAALGSWGVAYTNGAVVEYSSDGVIWTSAFTIGGSSEASTATQTFAAPIHARYVRASRATWLGFSEFRFT